MCYRLMSKTFYVLVILATCKLGPQGAQIGVSAGAIRIYSNEWAKNGKFIRKPEAT